MYTQSHTLHHHIKYLRFPFKFSCFLLCVTFYIIFYLHIIYKFLPLFLTGLPIPVLPTQFFPPIILRPCHQFPKATRLICIVSLIIMDVLFYRLAIYPPKSFHLILDRNEI